MRSIALVQVEEAEIRRGQRVALVGPNGSGKTTLLRTIPQRSARWKGVCGSSAVRIGYFAQVQDHLVPGRSVLETPMGAGLASVAETRGFLARYGSRGDDVFKDVAVLSGGERARVAIAMLSLAKANFLLLDEPTNHLDIAFRRSCKRCSRPCRHDPDGEPRPFPHSRGGHPGVGDCRWHVARL